MNKTKEEYCETSIKKSGINIFILKFFFSFLSVSLSPTHTKHEIHYKKKFDF